MVHLTRVAFVALAVLAASQSHHLQAGDKVEPGFKLIFNGKNLDGWKTTKGEKLDGMTEAYKGRFKVADGALVIDPKIRGNAVIVSEHEFGKKAVIRFDFVPQNGCNNDLFFLGSKFDIKKGIKNLKFGEPNELEIVVDGKDVVFKVNGEAHKATRYNTKNRALHIRAENGAISISRIRAKEGK